MLDQFIQMATSQLSQQFNENPNVPTDQFNAQEAAQTVGSTIFDTLSEQITGGNFDAVKEMLSGSQTEESSPLVNSLSSNVVNNLSTKNGINPQLASAIAAIAIPYIMNMFNKNVSNAQSNGLDIGGLLSSVMGGGQSNSGGGLLGGLLGSVLGGGNQQSNNGSAILGSLLSQIVK